ncbi:type II toxin-antitoxin system ParD family antitoxin [Rhizobium leguminosarum]|uniref:type II toxin-antitoxin system ParD family antitoxin n=1 Tax=Rhizobium leguminosarum TaxID=384 RepID=UPI003965773A
MPNMVVSQCKSNLRGTRAWRRSCPSESMTTWRIYRQSARSGSLWLRRRGDRRGLRLLQREAELAAIEAAIIEGEKSGKPRPFDFAAFIEGKRARRGGQ